MVDLARFERAASTFAESRSHSTELQVQSLAEGTGLEPASDIRAVVFGTTALPVRLPFRNLAGTLRVELRMSVLETAGLPLAYIPEELWCMW